ncbi:hypothetical protein Naga_101229g3 [Nannochloropsis gaditana]|uniref:Uncharacterized protein n=1 Tax=Nannochloropsis gaditana TaxID=72520 RepID=W7TCD1_9STRA|nr:hypothetical protein Naga_101229g3 [Nannochloropsis gaditana]
MWTLMKICSGRGGSEEGREGGRGEGGGEDKEGRKLGGYRLVKFALIPFADAFEKAGGPKACAMGDD